MRGDDIVYDGRNARRVPGFAAVLRELRLSRGMSQLRLSRMVGVDHTHISRLESGRNGPSPGLVQRIADALQLTPDETRQLAEAAGFVVVLPTTGREGE